MSDYDDGYQAGFQAGFQRGRAEGLAQIAAIIKQLDELRARSQALDLELHEMRRILGMMPRIN